MNLSLLKQPARRPANRARRRSKVSRRGGANRSTGHESDLGYQMGLLSFIRLSSTLRLSPRLRTVPLHRLPRAVGVTGGGIAGLPLNAYEKVRHGRRVEATTIDEPPVFIIGHWRSGTTHLHNLMSQDPSFGTLAMFQALAPDCSLSTRRWLPEFFERTFPTKRPMDNLDWPMDAPQEEEIPLTKVTPYSWYLQFLFPQQAERMFEMGVLFEGTPARIRREVQRKYLRLLKVASMHAGGRRLLLKNPVNTARIPFLLDLFPDAKFVVIHRSPYEVFPSTINLHRKILNLTSLQDYDEDLIEANVLTIYERVMRRYLEERTLVPEGNLVEVSYDDLDNHPLDTVRSIYERLGISGYAQAEPKVRSYSESQSEYRKNGFGLAAREAALVEDRWGFAFDEWGYERRSASNAGSADVGDAEVLPASA